MMKSFGSAGELKPEPMESDGVGGTEELGAGREGTLLGGAMGIVNERRLPLRDADELERVERVSNFSPGVEAGCPELVHG